MDTHAKALDIGLNCAVTHIVAQLFPAGFDASEEAPKTHQELKAHLESGGRMIVYSGGCENTIFGAAGDNLRFRAWHDWLHWQSGHDFSLAGERAVLRLHQQHLIRLYGDSPLVRRWCLILEAEVVGQRLYHEAHRSYVTDQRTFVEGYLAARGALASSVPGRNQA